MNTRPLRIFLLGTTLAVGAVVGLAPTSEAKPPIAIDPSGPIVVAPPTTAPPTTVKPPKGLDPCDLINCEDPPKVEEDPDCVRHPRLACPPETTTTSTTSTTTPPTTRPPKKHRPSDNPDVVVQTPRFTG